MSKRTLASGSTARATAAFWGLFLFAPALCLAEPVTATIADGNLTPAGPTRPLLVQGPNQQLDIVVGTSRLLAFDKVVPKVMVKDPATVKVTPIAADRLGVTALKAGETQVLVWDDDGGAYKVDVTVLEDPRQSETLLNEYFPGCTLRLRASKEGIVVSGRVDEAEKKQDVVKILKDRYPTVISELTVVDTAVKLHVALLELSLTKMEAEGIDLDDVPKQWHYASGATHLSLVDDRDALAAFVKRLKRKKIARLLASPTLMTVSGRPANFEAGREIPVAAEDESFEYKFVGTRVEMMPHVFADGRLLLKTCLDTFDENSQRDEETGRRVHEPPPFPVCFDDWRPDNPVVEFRPGQTLVVRGRYRERAESNGRLVPLLEDVPLVGDDLARKMTKVEEIETLLIVTPEWHDEDAEQPEPEKAYGAIAMISDQGSVQTK